MLIALVTMLKYFTLAEQEWDFDGRIKKTLCLITLIGTLVTLTACVNRKRNYFVNGKFESNGYSASYRLEIAEITKDEYNSSNFVNVVENKILKDNRYFRVNFYKNDEDAITLIDLINLQDSGPKTNAIPISYRDDNGITITPYYPHDVNDNHYYLVVYETSYLYFGRIN